MPEELVVHDTGPFKVELRRKGPGSPIYFRPVYDSDPSNTAQVYMNAELRYQGGAWAQVPPELMDEALAAFDKEHDA
jgi:hypothetical protein